MLQAVAEAAPVPVPTVAKAVAVEAPIPQAETASAAPTEAVQAKEAQPKPTLWNEIQKTAKVMVNQAISEAGRLIKEASGDIPKINALLTDPKNRALITIDQLRSLKPGEKVTIPEDQRVTITDQDGWQNTIVSIVDVVGDSFQVMVVDANNKSEHVLGELVSRQVLEQAHLLQKLAPHLGSFPESQGKIISMYLESVKSGKEPTTLPTESEKTLLEAAQSASILTTSDVEMLLKQVIPDQTAGQDASEAEIKTVGEKNESLAKRRERLLKPFADHGIVVTEPQQIIQLFEGLGVGPTQISEIRNKYAMEFTRLDLQIKAHEKMIGRDVVIKGEKVTITKELLRRWSEEQIQVGEYSDACLTIIEVLNKDGPMKQYFDQLNAGTLSQEEGRLVVESFHNGKIAEPPDINSAADKQSQIKLEKMRKLWKKQDALSNIGTGAKISGGILSALAAFGFLALNKKEA